MDYKKEFKILVESIKKNAKQSGQTLRNEDIAKRLDYEKSYFATLVGQRGEVKEYHLKAIRNEFSKELENTTWQPPKDDLLAARATIKVLAQELAKVQAKVYNRPVEDCLDDLEKNTILLLRELLKDKGG